MKNKPQLSAEMEGKLRLLLDETIEGMEGYVESDRNMIYSDALFCGLFDSQKHFLATALEEQKQHIITELRQVTEVHGYLSGKDCEKVARFIENLDKPEPEI
jgi:hypothetical protein